MHDRHSVHQRIGLIFVLALCSLGPMTQAQERTPFSFPPCTSDPFLDVPMSSGFCPAIQQFAADGITVGCGGGNYCPGANVTREQMAIFVERAMRGTATWDVNADLLDGVSSASFLRSDTSDSFTAGTLAIDAGTTLDINGALDLPAGGITKDGTLFLHNNGVGNTGLGAFALRDNTMGSRNTASGRSALLLNTIGSYNTGSGTFALVSNTTGNRNTASGAYALRYNTTGSDNTVSGAFALLSNTTGFSNTASGHEALFSNVTGYRNTASGAAALYSNTTGDRNIALGYRAGYFSTAGNDNILIGNQGVAAEGNTIRLGTAGTHTRAFIAGIWGVTIDPTDVTVMIDSTGQLGTVSSSRRMKEDIAEMAETRLLDLRPVTFRYKKAGGDGEKPIQYGLIAEEVAEAFPELVVYDKEGSPETVKYHLLSVLLLNELKKEKAAVASRLEAAEARDREQAARLEAAEARATAAETRGEEQASVVRAMQAELASWRRQQADLASPSSSAAR